MGPAYVGICLPSTCEATKLENFLNEKLNETLGGLFKPMGSKIVDEIKDAVYTSEPRPFTTGDIVTMYIAHSGISRHLSRSAHRTPNFTNPKYFDYLLFEYFSR